MVTFIKVGSEYINLANVVVIDHRTAVLDVNHIGPQLVLKIQIGEAVITKPVPDDHYEDVLAQVKAIYAYQRWR
jgi:hypothetical protein